MLRTYTAAVTGAALVVATLIAAAPAQAANTTPSDLYYPNGGCSSGALSQNFVDSSGNQITSDLYGDDGDQVTIHNQCSSATIYVYYGQSGGVAAYVALAAGAQASYTLTNGAASVQAYPANSGVPSLWASISVAPAPDIITTGSAASTTLSSSSVSTAVSSTFIILNNGSDTLSVTNGSGTLTASGPLCNGSGSWCDISSGQTKTFTVQAQGTVTVGSATLTIGSGGGGGSSSSSPATSQSFGLSITPTDGTSCSNTSPSGTSGTWITLPGANDCTVPPTKPGATLLGWATNANFPVDIAQRQVDNGWGAYETFNADGQLTGVFIPAGGATFLSAAGKLYPIWSE